MERLIKLLVQETGIAPHQIEAVIRLMDEGNTIPFIARYRKEATGGLDDEVLRNLEERLKYVRNLEDRKSEVLRIIDEQGKLTEELKAQIESATVLQRVEDLYRPYKQKKRTRGVIAREKGLEPLARFISSLGRDVAGPVDPSKGSISDIAAIFISEDKGVMSPDDAIKGALDIIAEDVSDRADIREHIRGVYLEHGILVSKAQDVKEKTVYELYYEFSEAVKKLPNHRILALDRGESEKALKISISVNDESIKSFIYGKLGVKGDEAGLELEGLVRSAVDDSFKRLISPSVENEVRNVLTDRAQEEAIKVFARNTKPLLMQAPVKHVRVLAIDPGFRTGCKVAVLDETGKIVDHTAIFPHEPRNDVQGSIRTLSVLIDKYDVDIISIGNGTASRETESLVVKAIKEIKQGDKELCYTIVSEAGASVYSASKLATEEYPDLDVTVRGAISIGRRLQDPLAELVKIDPKSIGVGQYQHDVNQKQLSESLKNVVEDCVNSVGVDLNTATPALLKYVSGINDTVAKNIVIYRDENGKFTSRKELLKVKKLGDKAFQQSAGFLRILDGKNPLDSTAVHPESYDVAQRLLDLLGYTIDEIRGGGISDMDARVTEKYSMTGKDALRKAVAMLAGDLGAGVPTVSDIIAELKKPGRDPREDMPKPLFRSDVLSIDDLEEGMVLTGTVRNVVDFGAFVDIGLKNDGLVHISELSDRFIKDPYGVVSVGDTVDVMVLKADKDRGKVSLSMKRVKKK
jgi:protein Tex